jgi:tripartite-type tricarboxylate transporter receptor subunit TctC
LTGGRPVTSKVVMKNPFRLTIVSVLVLFCTWFGLAGSACAEDFPSRPVTIVIGFAPGGMSDVIARVFQARLAQRLGVPVIIDNRPGAGGITGTSYVARSAPDGYTLLLTWDAHIINAIALKDLPYNVGKDFAPVIYVGRLPLLMVARKDLPANNVKEFVALAKTVPGKMNFASVGMASPTRLEAENLIRQAGIKVAHIPYKGAAPSLVALLSGEVAFSFLSYPAVRGQIDAGAIKALAVTGSTRLPELPNVPTMAESGFAGAQAYSWQGIFVPAGTPAKTIATLNAAINEALLDPEVKAKLHGNGVETVGGSVEDFASFQRSEYEKWAKFVRETKISFEE